MLQLERDKFFNARQILPHIAIGKSNDANTALVQKACPPSIAVCAAGVLVAIELNREARARTVEVKHIWTHRMLPAKGCAELIVAKDVP